MKDVWVRIYYWLNTCKKLKCDVSPGTMLDESMIKRVLSSCWIGTLQIYSPPMSVLCATIDWGMAQQIRLGVDGRVCDT